MYRKERFICAEHPITKDAKLDGDVIGYQLIFTRHFGDLAKIRWVPETKGDEQATVASFEKKYGVRCVWEDVPGQGEHSFKAYVIHEAE